MIPVRPFESFLRDGVVRRQHADLPRARSLRDEAERRHRFLGEQLRKIGISDENANYFVEQAYDTLMGLLRARMLCDGLKAAGAFAHEAEIAYLRTLGFSDPDVHAANELRYFRNGILYYGKQVNAEYARSVLAFLEQMRPRLLQLLELPLR